MNYMLLVCSNEAGIRIESVNQIPLCPKKWTVACLSQLEFLQKPDKLHMLYIYLKLFKKLFDVMKNVIFFNVEKCIFQQTTPLHNMLGIIDMVVIDSWVKTLS